MRRRRLGYRPVRGLVVRGNDDGLREPSGSRAVAGREPGRRSRELEVPGCRRSAGCARPSPAHQEEQPHRGEGCGH